MRISCPISLMILTMNGNLKIIKQYGFVHNLQGMHENRILGGQMT